MPGKQGRFKKTVEFWGGKVKPLKQAKKKEDDLDDVRKLYFKCKLISRMI